MHRNLRFIGWLGLALVLAGCGPAAPADLQFASVTPPGPPAPPGVLLAETSSQAAPATAAPGTPRPAVPATQAPSITANATQEAQAALIDRLNGLDAFMAAQAEAKTFGGAVLVGQGGAVLLSKGYGPADAGRSLANTPQTRFMIASLTKQFTATAVLMLQARRKLDVRDPVCDYLKDCPTAWEPITVYELLTHTSGIPDFFGFTDFNARRAQPMTSAQMVAWVRDKPLNFTPGKLYSYSNSGYNVLGYLIEQVSGQAYGAFLKQNIFDPLGMADSGYDRTAAGVAPGYSGAGVKAGLIDPSVLFAAGGLYSSVQDLYRWDQALYTHVLLPQDLLDEMFRPQVELPNQPGTSYGYGWVITSQAGRRLFKHDGIIDGYHSTIQRFPDERLALIMLSNRDDFSIEDFSAQAMQAIFP